MAQLRLTINELESAKLTATLVRAVEVAPLKSRSMNKINRSN